MQDHYKTLGLPQDATDETIRAAYRSLIQKYHPDRNSDANAISRTGEIIAAYSVLRKPDTRAAYDLQLRPPAPRSMPKYSRRTSLRRRSRLVNWLMDYVFRRERKF